MESHEHNYFETMIDQSLFAFLDIETTGFSPRHGDKILEIAIITTDIRGNQIDSYETLINPKRDVGATHIHGITAEMVKNAPSITEVMDDIIYHLNNKTIVGHNVGFDLRFLNWELDQYLKTSITTWGLCTLGLSKR